MEKIKKLEKAWKRRSELRAEGDKLRAEGDKLNAEGNLIWINTIIEVYGNVEIKWNEKGCVVEGIQYLE
jgi:hypothetical protein